ncbi:unnamed protein product [Rhizopus stolonifer]
MKYSDLARSLKFKDKALKQKDEALIKLNETLKKREETIEELCKKMELLNSLYVNAKKRTSIIEKGVDFLHNHIKDLEKEIVKNECEQKIWHKKEIELKETLQENDTLDENTGAWICLQNDTKHSLESPEQMKNKMESLQKTNESLMDDIEFYRAHLEKMQTTEQKVENYSTRLDTINILAQDLSERLEGSDQQILDLEIERDTLELENQDFRIKLQNAEETEKNLRVLVKEKEDLENFLNDRLTEAYGESADLENQLLDRDNQLLKLEEKSHTIDEHLKRCGEELQAVQHQTCALKNKADSELKASRETIDELQLYIRKILERIIENRQLHCVLSIDHQGNPEPNLAGATGVNKTQIKAQNKAQSRNQSNDQGKDQDKTQDEARVNDQVNKVQPKDQVNKGQPKDQVNKVQPKDQVKDQIKAQAKAQAQAKAKIQRRDQAMDKKKVTKTNETQANTVSSSTPQQDVRKIAKKRSKKRKTNKTKQNENIVRSELMV